MTPPTKPTTPRTSRRPGFRSVCAAAALSLAVGSWLLPSGHPGPHADRGAGAAVTSTAGDDAGGGTVIDLGPQDAAPAAVTTPTLSRDFSLGKGLTRFASPADQWVSANPADSRTPKIKSKISGQPTALWLTGDESFGNLHSDVAAAQRQDTTMTLVLYNIPGRWDGLSAASTVPLKQYQAWVDKVAKTIGNTRAAVIVEPDALWFFDRLASNSARTVRLAAMRAAVAELRAHAPRTRIYVDAGTSSGSVTPARMATLLHAVGAGPGVGFAVNVSSYSPAPQIQAYAQAIRNSLRGMGIGDPRYVIDTSRNGAATWNYDWCNPSTQKLGHAPEAVHAASGVDMFLWVKGPGTSDGDCGAAGWGAGTYGGEFMPTVAVRIS